MIYFFIYFKVFFKEDGTTSCHIHKMEQPLISVIIPIYNVEKYLRSCVDSVIAQSYKNLQIILVDDGSCDTSPQICDEYAIADRRIEVIHKKNGGTASARNAGIEAAEGEYITFVDSDDYINCNMYSELYSNLVKYNADICECGHEKIKKYKMARTDIKKYKIRTYSCLEFIKERYRRDYLNSVVMWNKLYKAEIFKSIRFPEGKLLEDLCTSYKAYFAAEKIAVIDAKLYYYVQRSGSATYNSSLAAEFAVEAYDDMERMCLERIGDSCEADVYSGIITVCKQNEILDAYYTAYLSSSTADMEKYAAIYAENKKRIIELNCHCFNAKCFLFDVNKKLFLFAFRIRNLLNGIIDKKKK